MYFVLQSARLNSAQKDYKEKPIWERYGPTFFTSMFVRFVLFVIRVTLTGFNKDCLKVHYNDSSIGMIHQDYLVTHSNISIMYQVRQSRTCYFLLLILLITLYLL